MSSSHQRWWIEAVDVRRCSVRAEQKRDTREGAGVFGDVAHDTPRRNPVPLVVVPYFVVPVTHPPLRVLEDVEIVGGATFHVVHRVLPLHPGRFLGGILRPVAPRIPRTEQEHKQPEGRKDVSVHGVTPFPLRLQVGT